MFQGCTELSGDRDAVDRKLKYSAVRSSYKYYEVSVNPGTTDGSAIVSILEKSFSTGHFDTVVELPILLELPPPPPATTPTSTSRPGRHDYVTISVLMKLYSKADILP